MLWRETDGMTADLVRCRIYISAIPARIHFINFSYSLLMMSAGYNKVSTRTSTSARCLLEVELSS